jgi:hypothetical protein
MMAGASTPAPPLKCCLHPRSSRVQHPYQPPGVAGEACFYPPTPALLLQRDLGTEKASFHPALFGHGCALSAAAGCSNGTAAVMCGRCPHRSELGAGCWLFPSPVLCKPTCGLEKKAWWLVLVPTSCGGSRQQRSECMATSSARHTVRQLQQKQQQQHCQPQSNHLPLHHQPAQSSLSFHLEPQPRTRTMRGSCKQRET